LWEALALTLAKKAGINVSEWSIEKVAGKSVAYDMNPVSRQQRPKYHVLSIDSIFTEGSEISLMESAFNW